MPSLRAIAAAVALAGAGATLAGAARADVVQSPPLFCLPGKTPITSHAGPRCVKNAPTDCPPGWRGILGGRCTLDVCSVDGDCRDGKRCVETDLCVESRPRFWENGGEPQAPAPAQAPSPLPDPAHPVDVPVGPCGEARACAAPAACKPHKLCLASGVARAAPSPANGVVGYGGSPPGGRCSAGPASAPAGGALAALAALVALAAARSLSRVKRMNADARRGNGSET